MPQVCNFIKKKIRAQVLSCEFCEILKNNCFYGTPPVVASEFHEALVSQVPCERVSCVTLRYYDFCVSLDVEVKFVSRLKHNHWKICAKDESYGMLGLGVIFQKFAEGY